MWLLQTNEQLSTLSFQQQWVGNVAASRCRCWQNVTHCRKKICSTCLFQESIPAIPFWNSKYPLPARSLRSLRGTVCSTNSALCLHHAHPFVAASEKSTCLMQRSKAFGHAIVVSKMFWNIVIVLSVVQWDCCKPTNACRDWDFSNSELEVGLPAFQLPMFAKCDTLAKGDLLHKFV